MGEAKRKKLLSIPKAPDVVLPESVKQNIGASAMLQSIKTQLQSNQTVKSESIDNITSDFLSLVTKHAQPKKPLLSIVTIYNESSEKEWLEGFIANLPTVNENGLVELILCKCIEGEPDEIKTPAIHRNGIKIYYMRCFYDTWNFAEARNAARKSASGEWILTLDSDEVVLQHQINGILGNLKSIQSDIGAIAFTVFSHTFDPVTKRMVHLVMNAYRLFRNVPEIYYQSRAHEVIDFTLKKSGYGALPSTFMIYHLGYEKQSLDNMKSKLQRNYDLLSIEKRETKDPKIKEYVSQYMFKTEKILQQIRK